MATDSVGSVSMSLKLDKNDFKSQLKSIIGEAVAEVKKEVSSQTSSMTKSVVSAQKSITSTTKAATNQITSEVGALSSLTKVAKGLLGALGIAVSIAGILSFGKACVDLGSNLQEVQNVVDVVYGDMNERVNEFASGAIKAYGMSETVAKNYMGTLGSMSKAFGYSTEDAYTQAEALTALAGDMASFYNKSTDETFNAVKAVYSGETEVLKQYGVVMTETALNEFALARGMGKTVSQMSEQEKVSLRLAFVQDKLAMASGDFARTQGSWANQTRVLSLQWESFKASIGQGLINVLTPVVQWLNSIMEAANGAAKAFANFTATIMGVEPDISGLSSGTEAAAQSAQEISDGISSAGGAAKKAAKQLLGFDKLNILSKQSSGGGGGGGGKSTVSPSELDKATASDSLLNSALSETKQLLSDIAGSFKTGFSEGLADFDYGPTLDNIRNIKDSIIGIVGDPMVKDAGSRFILNLAEGMGKATGALTRIAGVSAQTVTGGIERFFLRKNGSIKSYIIDMFDISGDIAQIAGNISISVANIFEGAFGTPAAESLVSSLLEIPAQIFMDTTEIGAKIARDILGGFYTIISGNEGGITSVLSGMVESAATVFETVSQAVTDMGNTVQSVYDEYINPFISGMSESLSGLLAVIISFWQENVQPILDMIGEKVQTLWDVHLKPLWDNLASFFGKVMNLILIIWTKYLQPVIAWIIKNILPVITPIIKTIIAFAMDVFGIIGSAVSGIIGVLGGLVDFISGVLAGDWSLAWEGIKEIFSGAWEGILGILDGLEDAFGDVFDGVVGVIKGALNLGIASIETFVNNIINAINGILGGINAVGEATGLGSLSLLTPLSLPRLAQGGFVEANTPQLAIVGDNRHEGEIIAPESKIQEAVTAGLMAAMPRLVQIIGQQISATTNTSGNTMIHNVLELDGRVIYDSVQTYSKRRTGRSGGRA